MTLVWLLLAIGMVPLATGLLLLAPTPRGNPPSGRSLQSGALFCALAFNLSFFIQEVGLVVPKALTPGLSPTLYHNDHDWTGAAPVAELLQGTGAIATLASGLIFLALLRARPNAGYGWRLFFFWMAFQGLFQSLSQIAIGTLVPGNDMGRALAYLAAGETAKTILLVMAAIAMAFAGLLLAKLCPVRPAPVGERRERGFGWEMLAAAILSIVVIIPFRLPREMIEVVLIPFVVNFVGIGWLIAGGAVARGRSRPPIAGNAPLAWPALALLATLALFQLVLRPGINF